MEGAGDRELNAAARGAGTADAWNEFGHESAISCVKNAPIFLPDGRGC
jgi:hypothetical protein